MIQSKNLGFLKISVKPRMLEIKAHFGRKYILDDIFPPEILAAINVVGV